MNVDIDLIKQRDRGYPKKDRKRNAWAWKQSDRLLKHKRGLMKWGKRVRCYPTAFELRGVCSCPTCGQPMSRDSLINVEKISDRVVEKDAEKL
jgi:hypothetical protein